jgi:hypothetical protein
MADIQAASAGAQAEEVEGLGEGARILAERRVQEVAGEDMRTLGVVAAHTAAAEVRAAVPEAEALVAAIRGCI